MSRRRRGPRRPAARRRCPLPARDLVRCAFESRPRSSKGSRGVPSRTRASRGAASLERSVEGVPVHVGIGDRVFGQLDTAVAANEGLVADVDSAVVAPTRRDGARRHGDACAAGGGVYAEDRFAGRSRELDGTRLAHCHEGRAVASRESKDHCRSRRRSVDASHGKAASARRIPTGSHLGGTRGTALGSQSSTVGARETPRVSAGPRRPVPPTHAGVTEEPRERVPLQPREIGELRAAGVVNEGTDSSETGLQASADAVSPRQRAASARARRAARPEPRANGYSTAASSQTSVSPARRPRLRSRAAGQGHRGSRARS